MKLHRATRRHLKDLMAWFPDRVACTHWGGPQFRFPFTLETFAEDAHWGELPSYVLLDHDKTLLGFGQYYLRANRTHLGRLAIAPQHRRRGLATPLIEGLIEIGREDLGTPEASLFVLTDNTAAIHCYRKLGFRPADYPGEMPELQNCVYMIRSSEPEPETATQFEFEA